MPRLISSAPTFILLALTGIVLCVSPHAAYAAIAIDASSPVRWSGTPNDNVDITSASFTAPSNALLVMCVSADTGNGFGITVSASDSGGLTWTNRQESDVNNGSSQSGHASVWTAVTSSSVARTASVRRTSSAGGTNLVSAKLYVVTGIDSSSPVGASDKGFSATNNITPTIFTSTAANSYAFVCGSDWNDLGAPSSSDLTEDAANLSGEDVISGYKSLGAPGAQTANLDAAGSSAAAWNWVALEAKPAPATPGAFSKPPNNLGLVGYWSFNEGTGTVVGDFSGNGNHGTLVSSPPWVHGIRGTALDFNGSGQRANVGTGTNLNITGAMTACAWINQDAAALDRFILGRLSSTIEGPYMLFASGATIVFGWSDDSSNYELYTTGSNVTTPGRWNHVCATRVSDSEVHIYVDGSEVSVTPSGNVSPQSVSGAVNVIAHDGAGSSQWNGLMDEVRIYSRALGLTEIAGLYGRGTGSSGVAEISASSATLHRDTSLANNLVGHWTFDGPDTQSTITDRSGSGNHGGFVGGATSSAKTSGVLGQALSFDGIDDGVLTTSNITYGSNIASVAFWGYWTDTSQGCDPFIVSGNYEAQAGAFYIVPNLCDFGDDLTVGLSGNSETARAESTARPSLNQWHHYVIILDHSTNAGDIAIYIDGSPQSTTVEQNDKNTNGNLASGQLAMMHFPASPTFASGKMDDVRIYNRALTAAEAKQLYNLGRATIRP